MFRKGALGDIAAVNVTSRSGPLFAEPSAWRRQERESRTLLFDFGIHLVDIALFFLGPVRSLRFVDADIDSTGLQRVVFSTIHDNGARGTFDFMLDAASASTEIEVFGESQAVALQFFPDGLRVIPSLDTPLHKSLAEAGRLYDYAWGRVGEILLRRVSHRARSHARLFSEYVASLRGRHPNPVPPEQVLQTIELLDTVTARAYGQSQLAGLNPVASKAAALR
jgi:predicted dehydrogenase